MKVNIPSNSSNFKIHESHSPEEVFAAGGTTTFGIKSGKNNSTLIKALEAAAPIEPFKEDEWAALLNQLRRDK